MKSILKRVLFALLMVACIAGCGSKFFSGAGSVDWKGPSEVEMIYLAVLFAGACLHYLNERSKGKTISNFMDYWVSDSPGSSVATLFTLLMGGATTLAGDALHNLTLWQIVQMALLQGYTVNSLVNQGKQPENVAAAAIVATEKPEGATQ